ncbi:MAG: hypothetical protein HY586_03715 [Candidatus Omnitrophica bacterium]|nr:hypothetical protein [Candidatus Omnitrophota bacterium]
MKYFALLLSIFFISSNMLFAQSTSPVSQTATPSPASSSSSVVQKDDKRMLTVMTQETKEPTSKEDDDFLSRLFSPVGDAAWGVAKTTSDVLGGACDAFIHFGDGVFKTVLSPFGFEQPLPQRTKWDEEDKTAHDANPVG